MFIKTISSSFGKLSGKLPLRTVLIVPFVLQTFGAVGIVGYLSFKNGQQAVNDVARQLRGEITNRIELNLKSYLTIPHQINQSNAVALDLGELKLQDLEGLERHFWHQIQIFDTLTFAGIGLENQENLGAERADNGSLTVRVSTIESNFDFRTYATNEKGDRAKQINNKPNFDPRTRPWYKAAVAAGRPTWSQIYPHTKGITSYLGAAMPYKNRSGKLQGVLLTNINLSQIGKFLQSLKVGKTGQSFIIERDGMLVATSTGEKPIRTIANKDFGAERIKAIDSSNPLTQATAKFLTENAIVQTRTSKQLEFKLQDKRHFLEVLPFNDDKGLDWSIVVVIPESDFMAQINANNRTTFLLCIAALIGSIVIGIMTARWVTQPILQLNETAKDIARSNWHQSREIDRNDEVGQLAKSFNNMAQQLQDSFETLETLTHQQAQLIAELQEQESYLQVLNESFLRFVPRQFLQLLEKKSFLDIQLGDQTQQVISVLFSDIRDFTNLSEMMTPEETFKFINGYLSCMEPAIIENHGFIDKYIGDAIMALFSGDADRAVTAGISMLQKLAEYNTTRARPDRPPIKIGIGINTGTLILGTVGGQSRMDGTVIGDAVNLASRLEGLTKEYRVPLLISDRTFEALTNPKNYHIRFIDRVRVKGKSQQVGVYEVFDADLPELRQGKLATQSIFELAIVYYYASNRETAVRLLKQCLQANPGDTVAQMYLQRCQ